MSTSRLCDGVYDCADYSDELRCGENIILYSVHVEESTGSMHAWVWNDCGYRRVKHNFAQMDSHLYTVSSHLEFFAVDGMP